MAISSDPRDGHERLMHFSKQETEENEMTYKNKPKTIRKIVIGTYISIITLNLNGLNAPTKRYRLAKWIQKQDPYICCLQETHFRPRDIQSESEGMEKDIPCKWKSKEAAVAILISEKVNLKNKEYYKRKRRTLHNDQGINPRRRYNNCKYLCTQHRSTSIHKAMLRAIKGEIDSNTVLLRDFNTLLSPMDRSSKKKINKETQALNDTKTRWT